MDFQTAEFHLVTWHYYLMLGFVSAHIPWNAISNLELRWSNSALQSELVLPSTSTLSDFCQREYTLTVDAMKKQLPSRNKVSLALDGWTSTNKLPITPIITYHIDRNLTMRQVQLALDEVDRPCFSYFERSFMITGQGSAGGITASLIVEVSS